MYEVSDGNWEKVELTIIYNYNDSEDEEKVFEKNVPREKTYRCYTEV